MSDYTDAMEARKDRAVTIFKFYNERRFDELLQFYADDLIAFMPELLPGAAAEMRYAHGKLEYVGLLKRFRVIFGQVTVKTVFPVGPQTSIEIEDEQGNFGTFSVELNSHGLIQRIFFMRRARRAGEALAA